jgi:hypothetical protein
MENLNTNSNGPHFGAIDMTIHYTLGAGIAEFLGDKVEQAVAAGFQQCKSGNLFVFEGKVLQANLITHGISCVSLHLSRDRDCTQPYSVDWDWF